MNLAKRLPAFYLVLTAFTIFFMLVSCGDDNGNSDDTDNCCFWVEIAEITNPSIYIQDVFFIDNDTGWVVGAKQEPHVFSFDNGTGWVVGAKLEPLFTGDPEQRILKTTDGGYTWIDQLPSGQIGYLYSVYFIDQNNGWVGGGSWASGQIYSTSNEGDIWNFSNIGDSGFIMDIHATDSNNVWAVGNRNTVLYSNNNFQTFENQDVTGMVGSQIWDIEMPSSSIGYIANPVTAEIYKTTNGGNDWNLNFTEPDDNDFTAIHFIDENNGWAGGDNMTLYHTQNGGQSWVKQNVPSSLPERGIYDIHFVDSNNGWLMTSGNGGEIWRTRDGGQNWLLEFTVPFPYVLNGIHVTDIHNGWAADSLGRIYKYQQY